MEIRIQPHEFTAPDNDPFANDLLDRQDAVEVLTHAVGTITGPCVISVDAPWGAGKTAFLSMWAKHLRIERFRVVEFNAWKTDFSGDPFVALTVELKDGLESVLPKTAEPLLERFWNKGKELLRSAGPPVARMVADVASSQLGDDGTIAGQIVGAAATSVFGGSPSQSDGTLPLTFSEERLEEYRQSKILTEEFRELLGCLAETLAASNDNKPLVLFIDELDRCRPSYAVELLESAKHLFSVDHIVFVLGVNRVQLAHSVKALYGTEFDAEEYLKRFVDLEYWLPKPDRTDLVRQTLDSVGYFSFFGRSQDWFAKENQVEISHMLTAFFRESKLSHRSVLQEIHRLGFVLSSLSDGEQSYARTLTVLFLIRSALPVLYQRFVLGEMPADEMVEAVFEDSGFAGLRQSTVGNLVEAVIIAAKLDPEEALGPESPGYSSGLFLKHRALALTDQPAGRAEFLEWQRSRVIHEMVLKFLGLKAGIDEALEFELSVRRLGLFSGDLMDRRVAQP